MISVVMGVYAFEEGIPPLKRSVDSILNQTWPALELIVEDSGSSKAVQETLDQIARSDKRVTVVRGYGSCDLASKLNRCIAAAKGDYIARQDDDDWSHPQRLSRQVRFLETHPDIAFVGCNIRLENHETSIGTREFPPYPAASDFLFRMPYCHPTLLFRGEVLSENRYCESRWCRLCEDYDLLLRLYQKQLLGANIQQPLFDYHMAEDNGKKRKFRHRINEAVTRFRRFSTLKMMPLALPFVIKPLIVGMLPVAVVNKLKRLYERRQKRGGNRRGG